MIKKKTNENLLIFLCWAVYMLAYSGRYSYNANINLIMEDFNVDYASAGLVVTCFFFAYGIGQVINGLCCKHYPFKYVLPCALLTSAGINLSVFLGVPFVFIKYLWLINGFAQSVLWSSLVMVLSRALTDKKLNRAIVVMSTPVAIGTFVIYGASALFVTLGNYKYTFLFGAACMIVMAIVWFIVYQPDIAPVPVATEKAEVKLGKVGTLILLPITLGICAIVVNFVKDGIQTWVPAILKETFALPDEYSILFTLLLPLVGAFSSLVIVNMRKAIPDFVVCCAILFATTALMTCGIIAIGSTSMLGVVALFSVIELAMHGANNIITSMVPLYMRDKINSGLLAGVLNGCCYLGSTVSSYGLGKVVDNSNWNNVFCLMIVCCVAMVVITIGYIFIKKTKKL